MSLPKRFYWGCIDLVRLFDPKRAKEADELEEEQRRLQKAEE